MKKTRMIASLALLTLTLTVFGCAKTKTPAVSGELTDDEIENIVRRSYQYVAMYNVNNKNAMQNAALTDTNGWNVCVADVQLKDHNFTTIARPNNDTLYTGCLLDLRSDPIIIEYPAFDSKYVVLETSAYDHYCDIPLSTTKGDFKEPTRILFYSDRTEGYSGEAVEGVDTIMEMSGDFVIAFLRVMPHAAEPERLQKNVATMQGITPQSLSDLQGASARPVDATDFPAVGSDLEVFENNFLEVMQFVLNHTTFDPDNELDQALLAALQPLGIEPGQEFDENKLASIDGSRFREIAKQIQQAEFARGQDPAVTKEFGTALFQPKGQMPLHLLVMQSVIGPIGLPAAEAMYMPVVSSDGKPMNAQYDYVIRMSNEEIPPARAFWSATLYDSENGFFIPNDRKKYSVGENAGMKLDADDGIEIYVAAEQPPGVPDENWLPINRQDKALDIIIRIYAPDLEKMETWTAPEAEKL